MSMPPEWLDSSVVKEREDVGKNGIRVTDATTQVPFVTPALPLSLSFTLPHFKNLLSREVVPRELKKLSLPSKAL